MNSGPLARAGYSERVSTAQAIKNASMGFEAALKTSVKAMGAKGETVSAVNLPFDEAIAFLRQKVSTPTESWRDVWDGAHSKMFMVAGANSKAIVDDFKDAIAKALEQGTTLDDFRKDFDKIVKTHGWSYRGERGWRTKTIFETNLRTAYAAGRYAQMTEPDTLASFPNWQYHHSGAVHPRLQHKAWDGLCLAADDPFWKTAYPPNGFGCGCFVTPVSRSRLRRLGKAGPDRAPDLDQLGTDQPLGVDPSFAYNPGQAWLEKTAPGPKAVSADQANVAAFVSSALRGKWPDGSWTPVATASKEIAAALDVKVGTEVRLSADTIRSHVKHEIASPAAYGVIPRQLASAGRLVQDANGRWAFVGEVDGQLYQAAVKVVKKGEREEIYLVSLRRTNANEIKRRFGK
ncbi:phage head morphogenesis protein [Rhizobium leguminosarum]|uniref:phage head morphogenesis protein n=1 Tax=Rhizobium leguminosarum TaxID=384 RepID=UPI00036D97EA|nr:phage minor head protein [Rhizobium leguminosarum]